jgi:hypothetical protein
VVQSGLLGSQLRLVGQSIVSGLLAVSIAAIVVWLAVQKTALKAVHMAVE